MPISDYITLSVKEKPLKEEKKKGVKKSDGKVKTCKDCREFKFFKNVDLEKDYYFQSPKSKGTIAFILSPLDFFNIKVQSWKHIVCSYLQDYNIWFLPYPKCCENPLFSEKITPSTYRICRDQFIDKHLDQYPIDLVVVFEDTVNILGEDADELKFIGNWANYKTRTKTLKMYYAKKLISPGKSGFDVVNFQHTIDKVKKYFDKQLIWQRNPNFKLVTTKEQLDALIVRLQEQDSVAVDYESNDFDVLRKDFVVKTIGLFFPNEAYCVAYEVPETPDIEYRKNVERFVQTLWADPGIVKIAHNLKFEMKVTMVKFKQNEFSNVEDTMFRSGLFDENRPSNSAKYLAGEYLDGYPEIVRDFEAATLQSLFQYNCLDCYFEYLFWANTFHFDKLPKEVKKGVEYCYREVMLPECYEIALLEILGVKVDLEYLKKLQVDLATTLAALDEEIAVKFPQTVGKDLGSPKQLADVLFRMLKYPVIKSGKTGPSTDESVLIALREEHGCLLSDLLLKKRQKDKQLSTYVTPYIENYDKHYGGRVHSNYMQTKNKVTEYGQGRGAISGRLSSASPNLQNIPRDKKIKRIFIPDVTGLVYNG
jgi:hypothetical protein